MSTVQATASVPPVPSTCSGGHGANIVRQNVLNADEPHSAEKLRQKGHIPA